MRMRDMIQVLLRAAIVLGSLAENEAILPGPPLDLTHNVPNTTKQDKNWCDIRTACSSHTGKHSIPPFKVTDINACKDNCVNYRSIKCQSIEYHEAGRDCFISETRFNSDNYTEPCYLDGWQYTERRPDDECPSSTNEAERTSATTDVSTNVYSSTVTTDVSTNVYSSTVQSTLECHNNKSIDCHTPPGENEVCVTKVIETCSDTLVCENITTSVCRSSSDNGEKVCENSTETECKTSTKDYFDEDGCASLKLGVSDHSSGLYTSLGFNIILILIAIVLACLLYTQTGCVCYNHKYKKSSLLLGPPAHSPTPPPMRNPVLELMAENGLHNPTERQSEHLYDSPHEFTDFLEMNQPQEETIPEEISSRRGSTHDSENSFYAAMNRNIQENDY